MSHWNYRVCKETYNKGEPIECIGYTIREVYYTSDNNVWGVTDGSKGIYGDSIDDIKYSLAKMTQAIDRATLDLDTLIFSEMDTAEGPAHAAGFIEQTKKLSDT